MDNIQLFTTPIIDGKPIEKYLGIVVANQVAGAGFFTDLTASFSDLFGGNSGAYRESMNRLCKDVIECLKGKAAELGANAVIGVSIDYDNISAKGMSMFMVSIYGTAVRIDDGATEIVETKEAEISWDELNLEYYKRKINRKIESSEPISDEEWDFLLKNDVETLTPSLYRYYQRCVDAHMGKPLNSGNMLVEPQRPYWANSGMNHFKKYLSKLDYKEAIKYVYKGDFKDIIFSNKLFSAYNILKIAQEGNLAIAISLLRVEKASYNMHDLSEMKDLCEFLQNLPDVGKREEVKGGLFSSGGMKFICPCGTKNLITSEYCSVCGKNIKGVNRQEQETINQFVELVEILAAILKK